MSERRIGWGFVTLQVVLLVVLVVLPSRSDWAVPGWLRTVGLAGIVLGLVGIGGASIVLGRSLTPTPVPRGAGELTTTGLYAWVRHPIYTGVLLVVVGLVVGSGSLVTLVVGVLTVVFFQVKARWEEHRLAEVYPDYPAYAARTPRFVPRIRSRTLDRGKMSFD
jgi:protein-S-isoprenylcysteine O-methyltransferase Ste14